MTCARTYYTYVIFADDQPVYVGKGSGGRCFEHLRSKPELATADINIKVIWADSEGEALAKEAALIKAYIDDGAELLNIVRPHVPPNYAVKIIDPPNTPDTYRVEVSSMVQRPRNVIWEGQSFDPDELVLHVKQAFKTIFANRGVFPDPEWCKQYHRVRAAVTALMDAEYVDQACNIRCHFVVNPNTSLAKVAEFKAWAMPQIEAGDERPDFAQAVLCVWWNKWDVEHMVESV